MTKKEFLSLAEAKWEKIEATKKDSGTFYDYEKAFDALWVEFGRSTLEGSIGEVSLDRRKKKQT